jgi:hypothetical protein
LRSFLDAPNKETGKSEAGESAVTPESERELSAAE